ncbi:hypothetical protein [Vibrio phage phiKT1028]|nr:hypothetical protein [Vibrio phage phiKT1028]
MLIKKIGSIVDLPCNIKDYRKGSILQTEGGELVIQVAMDNRPVYFHFPTSVCGDPELSLLYIRGVANHCPEAEVYGDFSPEVVSFLRDHDLYVNIIPPAVFHVIKQFKLVHTDDLEWLNMDCGSKVGFVNRIDGHIVVSYDEMRDFPVTIVGTGVLSDYVSLINALTNLKVYTKSSTVYGVFPLGLLRQLKEKGIPFETLEESSDEY